MCGLTGFWTSQTKCDEDIRGIVSRMAERIAYRGPDDSGDWTDIDAGIALAHRRLSIIDLSDAGHQPMLSASGRWVLIFNGEIYNHLELRRNLECSGSAPSWRGHSDTETLLAAIEAWGVEETLKRSVGMFAMALWDRGERALWLARDRLGEKPLYYGWQGDTFLFGSELKALRGHPAFDAGIDRGALTLLLRHNYIPDPYSIYVGISKLPPGTWLKIAAGERDIQPTAYWSLLDVAERGAARAFAGSDSDAVDVLEQKLGSAVRGQMMADVSLGGLLSGGIDSSLIVSLMQLHSSRPVRTYTIGFGEREFDEAAFARPVAAHLGTDHTEYCLTGRDAMALIPRLPQMYDEPFADSSQLPSHLVMQLARKHVTVALSGDAGDEFFAGYNRYFLAPKVWKRIGWMPASARRAIGAALTAFPAATINRSFGKLATEMGIALPGDKAHKLGQRLSATRSLDDLYVALVTEWPDASSVVVDGRIPLNLLDRRSAWPRLVDPIQRMMALDGLTYLPGDILVKVDRASMAASLETRAPFLDRDVVEFAWSLPLSMKLRDGRGKWLLRQLLDRHVPRALFERPKMGFSIPLDDWLRGPLREWAESLLAEDRLRREGFFEPDAIIRTWRAHLRGGSNFGLRLWSVLMFQAWLEQQNGAR